MREHDVRERTFPFSYINHREYWFPQSQNSFVQPLIDEDDLTDTFQ